jgi:hypothetical protein
MKSTNVFLKLYGMDHTQDSMDSNINHATTGLFNTYIISPECIVSHNTFLEHAVRDTKADIWIFTGKEPYLSDLNLPKDFNTVPFQQYKSIGTQSGDTCKIDNFVSLTESKVEVKLVSSLALICTSLS